MKALSSDERWRKPAIYLLNVTLYTRFRETLALFPGDVPVFINRKVEARYPNELRPRRVHLIDAERPITLKPLMDALSTGAALVALDTDQRGFQAVARYATERRIPVIPVYGHSLTVDDDHPLPFDDPRMALNTLQEFLLQSYMGPRDVASVHLFDELVQSARYYGEDRVMVKDLMGQATYRDVLLQSYVLGTALRRMIRRERVGVMLPNSVGHVVVLFAMFYAGLVPVMLNYSSGVQTVVDACETAGVDVILTSREFIDKGQLQELEQALSARYTLHYMEDVRRSLGLSAKLVGLWAFRRRRPAHAGPREIILFTSGSEYRPRGVVLTHGNIYANVQQTRSVIDFGTEDRMLNAMPMFHSFGLAAGALLPLIAGIQVYLYPSPLHYKRIPEICGQEQSTILFGTSSFLEKYGQHATPEQFRHLRYAVAGAERLKPEVEAAWLEKFRLQIMQGYGATETSPIMSLDTPINHKQGSVGRFLPGIRHRLEPVDGIERGGLLHVQGPNVMKGYLVHGEGFVEQTGWYNTGDVVEVDDEGFVTIVGRLKRFAKIAGEMISLNLVEQLAARAYGDPAFAAVSIPDPARGERIVLATTHKGLSLAPMRDLVDRLGYSRMHVPGEIRVIDEFPLLGSGKTDYVTLKAMVEKGRA
ncbi:AMP-binding protein [Alicyclobacillus vulcanalis]|uniref:Acyl-[acyl-carrier-protein]-phospholipid O-acyltransferase / long-chain-fatty-acid--[acyl-carrier-protein] ligase n=1 Tax=Alicyclobacillus vulcanalis TaxID=252246 RepID=A0A1N7JVH5_9BACL|nr:AMP-binding protein [Alicyclobacillus vulcanalis]SIS53338.1 acyl-[acyl-carrier-protein]-phospholipid O-acyltransferase / long-chain-fatty-acid--[acyl-carrier-protein] ligase [Alicyclobacillus vulcanalis]